VKQALTAADVTGLVAVVPTPARPDAASWRATETISAATTTAMIRSVAAQADMILTMGTFGEGATLTENEAETFTRIVAAANEGRVPIFAGATTLNTRDTINRARKLLDAGAFGLFLGRPMWCKTEEASIVGFYADVAEALQSTPMILYDNPHAFKGKISPDTYRALAQIPNIIAAKYVVLGAQYVDDVDACGDSLCILPQDCDWFKARRLVGDRASACWTGSAACGMSPLITLRDAILNGHNTTAELVTRDINDSYVPLFPMGDFALFSTYNIPLEKARIAAAGLIDPGPPRPPYHQCPAEYLAGAADAGRRWADLERNYQPTSTNHQD
jgi:dihydrodipicolinate synthase/N-acetylneuraminate lyase